MRLRSTALPTWRVTVKPNRGLALAGCGRRPRRCAPWPRARTPAVAQRAPLRTRRNSARRFSVVTPGVAPFAAFARALAIGHPSLPAAVSRRQALAALGAPPRHDRAAAGGCHALAETMPALAHELARLIGPFHVGSPFSASPCRGCADASPQPAPQGPAGARPQAPTWSRSELRALIGLRPAQVNPTIRETPVQAMQTINSFRFLSRVLDSRGKCGCQRLCSELSPSPSQPARRRSAGYHR